MLTIKTNKLKPIYNERFKLLGEYYIYLTIQNLDMDANNVIASGYYYYITENEETIDGEIVITSNIVKLKDTKTSILWDTVIAIETILSPITATTLKNSVLQRVKEFTILKLTEESGDNFGTIIEDWE
jgi:hypothetical protein